jgi:predicted flap endonuclease-1-like 5' DNA nuclease
MTAFALQTVLLMGIAYFLGTTLACLVRRSVYRRTGVAAERRVDPLPQYAQRDTAPVRFAPGAGTPGPQPRAAAAPSGPPPAPAVHDLKRIRLIDAELDARLRQLAITRFEQIAGWMRADVRRISQALGIGGRINQENWIEQAQVLAKGGETRYSARQARGEAATAAPGSDEGKRPSATPAQDEPLPRPMSRSGVAAALVAPANAKPETVAPAVPIRPAPPAERDSLQRIGGISPAIEQLLNAEGIVRYAQIAQWSAADVERFEGLVGADGRITRENWMEQAHILSRGGDTRFSREFDARPPAAQEAAAAAAQGQPHLGSLRSVRSAAYRSMPEPGPEDAERAAARAVVRSSATDDLKRIRGIGVLIEKRLNTLGVTSYEHIANWTAADIDRVSQSLDFKGRIERESWVEQARILSAGGHTEFSRRVDRGEVETSRPKA